MGWKGVGEGLSWVVVVPAVFLALAHPDVGELGLGAFGPPASTTLSRWLILGSALAGGIAFAARSPRVGALGGAALLSFGIARYEHRHVSTRDVRFDGRGIAVAATVYEPRRPGRHPAVVLVPGSAPLKRGFYSLWADQLARRGVVVVVPDKRGVGGTGGTFERNNNSSRANLELLASDVVSALDFAAQLSNIDTTRLGLFGLSQAGWVAPMAAVRSDRARFMILVTSPTVSVREEGVWSDLRGDDSRAATLSIDAAQAVIDTVRAGGVDARSRLAALTIPALWLFGANDNSIPTKKSVAVLDSLRSLGKPFEFVVYPETGHLLITRRQSLIPHIHRESWDAVDRWLATVGRAHD
jgi:dipeptidyl aminopeptidase/acylaminoacyl peptidase